MKYEIHRAYGKDLAGAWVPGNTHAVVLGDFVEGRFSRETFDALCQPSSKFARIEVDTGGTEVTCKKCIDKLEKFGESLDTRPNFESVARATERAADDTLPPSEDSKPSSKPSALPKVHSGAVAHVELDAAKFIAAASLGARMTYRGKTSQIAPKCIRVLFRSEGLELAATDYVVGWSAVLDGSTKFKKSTTAVGVLILARTLTAVVSALSSLGSGVLRMTLLDSSRLVLEMERFAYHMSLVGYPAADFPDLPLPTVSKWVQVEASSLAVSLERVRASSSDDAAKANLHGAHVESSDLVATDGHRLHWVRDDNVELISQKLQAGSVDVPRPGLEAFARVLAKAEGEVSLGITKEPTVLFCKYGGCTISVVCKPVQFPASWRNLVPESDVASCTVDAAELVEGLDQVLALNLAGGRYPTWVDIDRDKVTVASATELGETTIEVSATGKGKSAVAINPQFLRDAVTKATLGSGSEGARVELCWSGAEQPFLVKSTDGDFVAVVMPMRADRPRRGAA
ncbi:MAG: hypothetical protein HC927_10050 [Deltaproteobacteria bacterium]|nr:hypothetical protein [Deltaproteobacteria bacterium]